MGLRWLALMMVRSVGASPQHSGDVLVQLPDRSWILQYNNARYACETTPLCRDFRVGMQFVAHLNFERDKELVEYLTSDRTWNDCVVVNCKLY